MYIRETKWIHERMQIVCEKEEESAVRRVIGESRRYLDDAEHFRGHSDCITALIAVAYSGGLMDALRLLNLVEYRWTSELTS